MSGQWGTHYFDPSFRPFNMKRLLLHIGTGKTGTSSIQNFLFENRKILADQFSLYYPEFGLSKINHFGELIHAHYPVVLWIKERQAQKLEELCSTLKASNCETAVISCENLYHHLTLEDIAYLANAVKDFSVEIICYVRRQDFYMESAWKQQVKVGALSLAFPDFLKLHTQPEYLETIQGNYFKMLKKWAAYFGTEAVKVRVFHKSEWVNGDLIDDFLNACGFGTDGTYSNLVKLKIANAALPTELILLMRKFNAMKLIPKSEQEIFVKFLKNLNIFNEIQLLSNADRLAIIENYREANISLFTEFCHRKMPQCFRPGLLKKNPNGKINKEIFIEDIAVRAIAAMWKQSPPYFSLKIKRSKKLLIDQCYQLKMRFFSGITLLRNHFQAKDYKPRALEPNKINKPSPFVLKGNTSPLDIQDYDNFYFYGFSKLPSLKSTLLTSLPSESVTVSDCFISAASVKNNDEKSKILLGALYENGQVIKSASFRGATPGLRPVNSPYVDQNRIKKSRLIPDTCVYLGWLLHNFGHLLLEAPARFWFLNSINVEDYHFIFHPLNYARNFIGQVPIKNVFKDSFTQILFESFGIDKKQIILADQDLCVKELIIPSSLFFLNQTIDSTQMSIYNKIKYKLIQNTGEKRHNSSGEDFFIRKKLYLSRRLLKTAIQNRKAINEEELEQLFKSYGFEIIFPERLSLAEQIILLNKAEIIAGCDGSALHMGVFLPPSSKIITLTTRGIITNQLLIGAMNNIETHFINAGLDKSTPYKYGKWRANIPFIQENLEQILNARRFMVEGE
ncbi:MAG: glycosyltransferase family 61 protein [Methylococcaceae bacterium]|nr:glycosyltransferase family 61 protein [Methylococcaceae bacterium]